MDLTAAVAQAQRATTPELLSLIAERGLRVWNRTNSGTPAPGEIVDEILACEAKFCVLPRVAPSTAWTTTCLRPPFEQLWLEYPHLEMLCGALITETGADRYTIQFVTSGREGTKKPLWWPGAEIVDLAADGSLARRQPATSDPRNRVAKYQIDSVTGVFDAVYTHLSLIHKLSSRNAAPTRVNTTAPVLPARSHELDDAVVLMWGEGPSGSGAHLDTPRHAPIGHAVRGHQRRLRDGGTTWVRPHRRGAEAPVPAKSRFYQVKKKHGT
ncbi:hypothetical protein [Mycobacterium sp. UM_Kg27]|uniref:hypothetical protein n=1 Tax=Mycobacterium sp. UM_Kg27 TaxID=1545693 RepID=UPI00178CEF5B|nr:hypothetical protein [Mycobacterium sp. UM_Kg27]